MLYRNGNGYLVCMLCQSHHLEVQAIENKPIPKFLSFDVSIYVNI